MPYIGRPMMACDDCGGIVAAIECPHRAAKVAVDLHPLRHSKLTADIERILYRRSLEKRLDGYTLETALEIAETIVGPRRPHEQSEKGADK